MPFLPALIGAGAGLFGGLINSLSARRQNRESMRFSERMYDRQYQDNIAFWNMQNEYNSPQAQMQRYQAAGLNPNLIYGQGSPGNAGQISTPDVQPAQFRTPEWGNAVSSAGLTYMNAIYDLDIKQAQVDNLKAQNSVIQQDALLRAQQVNSSILGQERTAFDLDFARDLRDINAQVRSETLRQMKNTTDIAIREDARRAALTSSSLQEAAQRMLNMTEQRLNMQVDRTRTSEDVKRIQAERARIRESIELMKRDGTLKDLDIKLRRAGINPQDPMWARIVGQTLDKVVTEGPGWFGRAWDWLKGR